MMTVVSWAWAAAPRRPASPTASRGGNIPPGTSLAEAMAVLALAHGSRACRVAEIEADDPLADNAALETWARWCRRFSPTIGIAESEAGVAADCIQLDVTGTAGFFGGEARLARTTAWTLAARGLHARVAVADTVAASWAAAHHTAAVQPPTPSRRRRWLVVPSGEAAAMLAGLPLSALRLDGETIALAREVGIDSIGGVLRLPARSLAARFSALLSRRIAQFSGMLAEPIVAPRGMELPQASHAFDFPVSTADIAETTLVTVIERLVTACVRPLAGRGAGVSALQVRLEPGGSAADATAAPTVIDVGLFRASGSPSHLVDLVRLRLAHVRPPDWLDGVTVEVVAAGRLSCRQRLLFGAGNGPRTDDPTAEIALLCDRLAGRLGRSAVFEPFPLADAQPEHAWIALPPGFRRRKTGDGRHAPALPAARRPIWMPPRPVRIELLDDDPTPMTFRTGVGSGQDPRVEQDPPRRFRVGGRDHRIVQAHGPERIETAWWRGPTVRRDYYVVETDAGERFWLFRQLRSGGWFLHGLFA